MSQGHGALAEDIYQLMTSRKFRRDHPTDAHKDQIMGMLESCIADNKPIPMMKYWGKTLFDEVGRPEAVAMDFLAEHLGKIADIYEPGIDLKLLFVDSHVRFNGTDFDADYLGQVDNMMQTAFVGHDNITANLELSSQHLPWHKTPDGKGFEEYKALEGLAKTSDITEELAETLAPRADTYYTRTGHDEKTAGTMYYELCKLEREPMGKAFSDRIFVTYNPPQQNDFSVPEGMPAIHINSLKRGVTEKPWNIGEKGLEELARRYHKQAEWLGKAPASDHSKQAARG